MCMGEGFCVGWWRACNDWFKKDECFVFVFEYIYIGKVREKRGARKGEGKEEREGEREDIFFFFDLFKDIYWVRGS